MQNDINNQNMLPVGTMLRGDTYEIKQQLSSGGFGNTYLVQNVRFNETYAMKEFFMRGINLREGDTVTVSVPDNKATFESQKEKLKKEALRLRKLHNAHIVQVHDLFEERGTVYYVMDYIDGESLGSRLQRTGKPLAEAEAMDVLRQILEALDLVHSQSPQLLHLDIKPANIMVDRSGCAYLIDFGASKQIATDDNNALSTTTGMSYTAGYAPSEQIEQNYERMGPWTDFYALGATLYKLVTLQQPPTPSDISDDGADAFHFPASVSASCRKLICWMMTPSRKKRPQSVHEIRQYLQKEGEVSTIANDVTTFCAGNSSTNKIDTIDSSKPMAPQNKGKHYLVLPVLLGIFLILSVIFFVYTLLIPPNGNDKNEKLLPDTVQMVDSIMADSMEVAQIEEDNVTKASSLPDETNSLSDYMEKGHWTSTEGGFKVPAIMNSTPEVFVDEIPASVKEWYHGNVSICYWPLLGVWAVDEYPDIGRYVSKSVKISSITYSNKSGSVFSGYTNDGRIWYMKKRISGGEVPHAHILVLIYPKTMTSELLKLIEEVKAW